MAATRVTVTLPEDLAAEMDRSAENRSFFIARAVRAELPDDAGITPAGPKTPILFDWNLQSRQLGGGNQLMPINRCLAKLALAFALLCNGSAWGFPIVLTDAGGAAPGSLAGDAFAAAAARYGPLFTDPINVYLNIGFSPLGAGTLSSTTANYVGLTYSSVRAALVADLDPLSAVDALATANLPVAPALQFLTNLADGSVALDNNASANNVAVAVTQANARALGLFSAFSNASDGSIVFNSILPWDYDPSDGITPGTFDFVGVATHEMGHALGFVSGVDVVDIYTGTGPLTGTLNLENFAYFTPLDFFRYTPQSVLTGPGVLGLTVGGTPFFSLDGGSTSLATFSTGRFQGDGRQASHWKDSLGWGLMDPTFSPGELGALSQVDMTAFDAIGFNLATPELNLNSALCPLTILLGGFLVLFERRKRAPKAA